MTGVSITKARARSRPHARSGARPRRPARAPAPPAARTWSARSSRRSWRRSRNSLRYAHPSARPHAPAEAKGQGQSASRRRSKAPEPAKPGHFMPSGRGVTRHAAGMSGQARFQRIEAGSTPARSWPRSGPSGQGHAPGAAALTDSPRSSRARRDSQAAGPPAATRPKPKAKNSPSDSQAPRRQASSLGGAPVAMTVKRHRAGCAKPGPTTASQTKAHSPSHSGARSICLGAGSVAWATRQVPRRAPASRCRAGASPSPPIQGSWKTHADSHRASVRGISCAPVVPLMTTGAVLQRLDDYRAFDVITVYATAVGGSFSSFSLCAWAARPPTPLRFRQRPPPNTPKFDPGSARRLHTAAIYAARQPGTGC